MGWSRLLLLIAVLLFASITWDLAVLDRVIAAMVVVLMLAWLWNRLSLSGIGFERHLQNDRVNVGERVVEEITLTNHSRFPKLWIEVIDGSSLPGHMAGRVVSLSGKSSVTWQVETIAVRRGRYKLGPIRIAAGDPIGLFNSPTSRR